MGRDAEPESRLQAARWRRASAVVPVFLVAMATIPAFGFIAKSRSTEVKTAETASASPGACNHGEALSGGFDNPDFSPATSKMFLLGFNPTEGAPVGSSWRVTAANLGTSATGSGHLRIVAYCTTRQKRLFRRTATTTVRAGHTGGVTARCPRGSEAVSGGFSMDPRPTQRPYYPYVQLFGYESRRMGHRGWHAEAVNAKERGAERLMALVKCDPREPGLHRRSSSVDLTPGATASADARCGPNRKAAAGGFKGEVQAPSGDGSFPLGLERTSKRGWKADAFSDGGAAAFTAYVYCQRGHR